MANGFFGDDALEGFLNVSMFAASHLNPSGNILQNTWNVVSGLAGQAFENMDWNFDADPLANPTPEASMFFSGSDAISSVDELGLEFGNENTSDPFAGIESAANLFAGLVNPLF